MHMSFYQVHTPLQAKADYTAYFEKKGREMGLDRVATFEEGEVCPKSLDMRQRVRRRLVQSDPVYAAMIRSMDEGVGRIMDALEKSGKADNTVVFFTSDNGGLATSEGSPTCNAPLAEGKGWMYEGGTREPLIVRWPGVIRTDSRCDVPVTSPDFYPTMLEMAGLPLIPEQHCDGVSIMSLLKEEGDLDREAIFWHYPHYGNQGGTPGSAVRAGDWKLLEFFEDGRLELYNLRWDIGEEVDIAGKHPDVVQRLHTLLKDWRDSVEAKYPSPNPDWPW
jgi:arylsulfatase A-like enzyme